MPDSNEQEWAEEWLEKGRTQDRMSRDEVMARGGSPPPKLEENNMFTEGTSFKDEYQTCV